MRNRSHRQCRAGKWEGGKCHVGHTYINTAIACSTVSRQRRALPACLMYLSIVKNSLRLAPVLLKTQTLQEHREDVQPNV